LPYLDRPPHIPPEKLRLSSPHHPHQLLHSILSSRTTFPLLLYFFIFVLLLLLVCNPSPPLTHLSPFPLLLPRFVPSLGLPLLLPFFMSLFHSDMSRFHLCYVLLRIFCSPLVA
jgi:hypothetical protein